MKPSQSIMNDQHRATNSEWYCIKARTCSDKGDQVAYSTIHELLNRIEALEATQHAHANASHVIDPEKEKMAQEFMQAAGFAPRWSDFDRFFAGIQAPQSATTAQPNHPEIPGSSLVERVANAMNGATEWQARAAIREVAAWLLKNHGGQTATTDLLEQEAER